MCHTLIFDNDQAMEETLFNTQAAGDWLHEAIPGESPAYWRTALINNRRADRHPPHRISFVTMGRGAFYEPAALQAFAGFEKMRRLGTLKLSGRAAEAMRAFGIGEVGGGTTGRKLNITAITPQIEDVTGMAFVQIITRDPFMVYRLEVPEAQSAAKELTSALSVLARAGKTGNDTRPKAQVERDVFMVEIKEPKQ